MVTILASFGTPRPFLVHPAAFTTVCLPPTVRFVWALLREGRTTHRITHIVQRAYLL